MDNVTLQYAAYILGSACFAFGSLLGLVMHLMGSGK